MNIEEMKRIKREHGFSNEMIAKKSGIPMRTVQKIFSGKTKTPRYTTMKKLDYFFSQFAGKHEEGSDMAGRYSQSHKEHQSSMVAEASAAYGIAGKKQGEYTLEDYYALPEDQRVELIDGVFYDMTAPKPVHQFISGELHVQIYNCIRDHQCECEVYYSPIDVQLDKDNRTMVQPDIIVLCGPELRKEDRIYGAPDFVIEVLSPSTRKKDMTLKQMKYQNAGVREYWMVDTRNRKVIVCLFGEEPDIRIYGFDDPKIPIDISQGQCFIDFADIYSRAKERGMLND